MTRWLVMWLYNTALGMGLLLSSPWWLFRMLTTDRYREGLADRLGLVPEWLEKTAQQKRVIWVHAVSVGEVLAAMRLVAELEQALGERWRVVVSTTTTTGQALARERFRAERVFYMPLDFPGAVRAYLRVLRPRMLVLMESELWPRLLYECGRKGVPAVVVNARVSDRSFARSMRFRAVWRWMARGVGVFLAQSELDAERLRALGAGDVRVSGNLKYDVRAPKESRVAELIKQAAAGRPIVVAGSTVDEATELREECAVIRAWERATRQQHGALLVIAPRHPERFGPVHSLIWEFVHARASEWKILETGQAPRAVEARANNMLAGREGTIDIVLLDTIGDLAAVYGIADVAFVGGSLLERGGHNPLEPAQFGVPVVMGESFENFREIVSAMKAADAIRIVKDEFELENAFQELLTDHEAARAMGERGRRVFEAQQGATKRTVDALLVLIAEAKVTA